MVFMKIRMASQKRFELPTDALEGRCSIQLSYWDTNNNIPYVNRLLQVNMYIFFQSASFSRKKSEMAAFVFSFDLAWYNRTRD